MEKPDKEKELLIAVTALFMQYGIKSLTMDDISRHLGISKKTLYLYVSDKKDLVKKALELAVDNDQCMLSDVADTKENPIDELLAINIKISEKLQGMQPAVMYDLQQHYPEAWKIMENHKQSFVFEMVVKNIHAGIAQGLYRKNANPEMIAKIYVTMLDQIFKAGFFAANQYTFQEMHKEIARYHLRGIASKEGINYIEKHLKNNKHDF